MNYKFLSGIFTKAIAAAFWGFYWGPLVVESPVWVRRFGMWACGSFQVIPMKRSLSSFVEYLKFRVTPVISSC